MEIYTEDKVSVTSSILLSKARAINFLEGNGNIQSIITTQPAVLYIDVVPDNHKLIDLYTNLAIKNTSLVVVPVPCIEYFILLLLDELDVDLDYNYSWMYKVHSAVLSKHAIGYPRPPKNIGYKGSFRSFERQCKMLLENCNISYRNVDALVCDKNVLKTSWYLSDSPYANMLTKSILLWLQLPGMFISSGKLEFNESTIYEYIVEFNKWLGCDCKMILPDKWWEEK